MSHRQTNLAAYFVVLTICLLLAATSALADADSTGVGKENSLKDGASALQFQIHDDFELSDFEGATLSYKKHTRDNAAWRLGLGLAGQWTDQESSSERDDMSRGTSNRNQSRYDVDLSLRRVFYSRPNAVINFFWGVGPELSFWRQVADREEFSYGILRRESHDVTRGWGIGLGAILGVEWFVNRSISLLAEYGSYLEYYSNKSTYDGTSYDATGALGYTSFSENKSDGVRLQAHGVKFGLSVYF